MGEDVGGDTGVDVGVGYRWGYGCGCVSGEDAHSIVCYKVK